MLDIRRDAWSFQAGFDRATLRCALERYGIAYRHRPEFGTAPELLRLLHEERDWDAFAVAYRTQIARQEALLNTIAAWARGHVVCLLSREYHAESCHRSLLATRLAELAALRVEHLSLW